MAPKFVEEPAGNPDTDNIMAPRFVDVGNPRAGEASVAVAGIVVF